MTRLPIKPRSIRISTQADDHKVAKLAAIAITLHMIEAVIPSPLPGVKPGLANIITLYVLYQFDFATAAWVSLLRVFAASFLFGQFLSPTFVLSLGGALASLLTLYFAQHLPRQYFSAISLSLLAAYAHIAAQLVIVSLWLIPHSGIGYLIPVFVLAATIFGISNGFITQYLIRHSR
jgi:heptaprenyl diphosphate synthase